MQAASAGLGGDPGATLSPEDIVYTVTTPPQFGYLEIEPSPFDDDDERREEERRRMQQQQQPEVAPTSVLGGYPSSPFEVRILGTGGKACMMFVEAT